jgi:hypothetical protein
VVSAETVGLPFGPTFDDFNWAAGRPGFGIGIGGVLGGGPIEARLNQFRS